MGSRHLFPNDPKSEELRLVIEVRMCRKVNTHRLSISMILKLFIGDCNL
jgi:hypothetical protein